MSSYRLSAQVVSFTAKVRITFHQRFFLNDLNTLYTEIICAWLGGFEWRSDHERVIVKFQFQSLTL